MVAIPVALGSLFSYFLPQQILKTQSVGVFNFVLEFLIRSSNLKFIKKLRGSQISSTLIFALFNIVIMCGMFNASCPNFWFSKFNFEGTKKDTCECVHENFTCRNYLFEVKVTRFLNLFKKIFFQEVKKSTKFALGICIGKVLIPKIQKMIRNPQTIPKTLLKEIDYKLLALLVGFNGIFKVENLFNCKINIKIIFLVHILPP